ncbi:metallophosphoesterase [Clostridium sp. LP20]|uniref:metallophosphoesterase n=1 Tax=Clostridium sp. LP20 TaxID=3418665 RepID=UPI003EE54070
MTFSIKKNKNSRLFFNYLNIKVDITNIELSNKKLHTSQKIKVIHLSDLHCKAFGRDQNYILSKIEGFNPDLVVFTGDLIDGRSSSKNYKHSYKLMKGLTKYHPVYYVTGNHEYYSNNAYEIKSKLIDIGVSVLNDEHTTLSIKDTIINIYGLDDGKLNKIFLEDKLREITKDMDNNNLNILLSHRPELFDTYSKFNFDFIFSGHAHGGQFRIPFTNQGLIAPGQGLFPKLTEGTHTLNNSTLIVSRGLGNSLFPFRLFNQPEIVALTIKGK